MYLQKQFLFYQFDKYFFLCSSRPMLIIYFSVCDFVFYGLFFIIV